MANPFDRFTSREMKEEIARREKNAQECWRGFYEFHGNPIAGNFFFAFLVALCTVFSGLGSLVVLTVFFMDAHSWTNVYTGVVGLFLLSMFTVFWATHQKKQIWQAFCRIHSEEAQELGIS